MGQTLAEKVWDAHIVHAAEGEPDLLYIDLHLVHEVTSPQAFEGLRLAGRPVRRPDLTLATEDHNVPTSSAAVHAAARHRQSADRGSDVPDCRSTPCARTARNSASGCFRWAMPSRASCTSSARNWASPSRA